MTFNPVSSALIKARYLGQLPWFVIALAAFVCGALWWTPWLWGAGVVTLVLVLWLLWLIPMQVRNMGWLETPDELVIAKGKLWHTVTVVPYGRIQFVDVTAGPLDRLFGLKSVELHTASSSSDSRIDGLPADTADELRDRLAIQARERMSGL
ncbi:PH domain-containing protein [Corynebacterium canis]|uniref:PH domain-containing protein n=1 Tax=Corynebacterium canis TaxID=679663 RepID=A0A5C5UFR6_9CORY|nr:PH domain-containing protein [Corynebacterium canis]TWT24463.1 PH domain-containing protein [Corynebacterium canis]WJY74348.1 Bacterial membrane flanked domain protein [Corynebacterium canis]